MANTDFDILATLIEKINTELEKTTAQIGKMETRIQGFKNTIAEGGLGTFQIQQLNEKIDTFVTKIERAQSKIAELQSRKVSAIDTNNEAQQLKALESQSREIEKVSKSIDTLERKLESLQKQQASLGNQKLSGQDYFNSKLIEEEIAKAERAINSFQSRLRNKFTPQGVYKTPESEAEINKALQVPAGRLEKATGTSVNERQNLLLKDAIVLREIAQANQKVTETAEASNKAFQDERTLAQINQKKAALEKLTVTMERLKSEELTEGKAFQLQNALGMYEKLTAQIAELTAQLNRATTAQDRFASARTHIPSVGGTDIPNGVNPAEFDLFNIKAGSSNRGFTGRVPRPNERLQSILPGFDQYGVEPPKFNREYLADSFDTPNPSKGNLWDQWGMQAAQKKAVTTMTAAAEAEQKRIQGLQEVVRADKRYANAIRIAEEQGFTMNDLKNIRTRGTGGINQLQFQKSDELGIRRNLDIYSSPSGRATPGISNQFRTFGQGVVRDIGELTKWSIALAAVYGPMQKVGELTQEMIANQTKLAEATITVNSAFVGQTEIFNMSADAANKSGEAISGVIDAFTQAYRATGGTGDEVTRLATAQKLLSDALILSKLSSLDQATAIDTLGASVRQAGQGFDYTTKLLDSWVRVTKVANVDLATLATGFATVGDAADTAGLKADDLNGILATLAESTNQSGQEVANTSRAIISGFQSDQGIKALENLGIATKDAAGNMRSLKDVIQEIAALRSQKIIDDTQFSKLTLAIGGGTRRQAAVATFLENYDRALAVSAESARANGDAQDALDKQLETVQTSLTRLANAFTTLAQTLGAEGGFLSVIETGIKGTAGLVNIFNSLVGVLGKATPALAAFLALTATMKYKGIPSVQAALGGVFETTRQPGVGTGGYGWQQYMPGTIGPGLTGRQKASNFASQNLLGTNAISGAFQGILVSALPAFMNAMSARNGTDRFGGVKAGADVIGGITGGIVGSLVAGSPVIGAAVGTAISEAFVNSTVARSTDIFAYNTKPTLGPAEKNDLTTETGRNQALETARTNIYKSIGGGNEAIGKFLTTMEEKSAKALIDSVNEAIKSQDATKLDQILNGLYGKSNQRVLAAAGISSQMVQEGFANRQQVKGSPEYSSYLKASPEAQKEYDKVLASIKALDDAKAELSTPFTKQVEQNKTRFGTTIEAQQQALSADLARKKISGDVSAADYARQSTAISGYDTKALQYYTALGEEFKKINEYVNTDAEAFDAFSKVIVQGAENSVPELTAIVGQIEDLTNILNNPTLQTQDALASLGFKDLGEVENKLKGLKTTGAEILSSLYKETSLNSIKVPNIQGDISKPLTTPENKLVEQRTKQLQDQFYQGFLKLPDAAYDALKASFEEFAVTIKDSGDEFYKSVTDTDAQFRQAAIKQLEEEKKLKSQMETPFNIQQVDMSSAQGAGLQGSVDYFTQYLAQNFPQYKQNPEDVGIIFNDYVTSTLHGDNLAIKLALEKIVDLNQKQLDGMYNIPEGATFWVPLQAAYYRPKDNGSGTGMPTLDATAVDGNTTATDANTRALEQLSSVMSNADRLKLEYQKDTRTNLYGQDPAKRVEAEYGKTRGITQYAPGSLADEKNRAFTLGGTDRSAEIYKLITDALARLQGGGDSASLGYRGDPGYTREGQGQVQSFVEQLKQAIFQGLLNFKPYGQGLGVGSDNLGATQGSVLNRENNVAPQPLQARLDMRFDNSVQLIVDGRVLASVITPYLASDLIKMEASQGTITKRYVI